MNVAPIPIIRYNEQQAANAYEAYIGILTQQIVDPALTRNPEWNSLRQHAYNRFERAYEAPL